MEYIVFCDEANKAYELEKNGVCPACGDEPNHSTSHVVMGVPKWLNRLGGCNLFRSFLVACKVTKGDHYVVRDAIGDT